MKMKIGNHKTVIHAFIDSVDKKSDTEAIHVVERSGEEYTLTYSELYRAVGGVVSTFRELGLIPGERLICLMPTSRYFFYIYLAALFSGVIPIVVLTPRLSKGIHALEPQLEMLIKKTGAKYIAASREIKEMVDFKYSSRTVAVDTLCRDRDISNLVLNRDVMDIAHLQPTSGTTGTPRLAVVRHGNITANVKGIGTAIRHRVGDILVSWLPLSHDMGLIGISYALYWQCPLVMSDPINFIRNPINWLRLISRFRGTLSPAPNSAFQTCARLAQLRTVKDIDLSCWRVALCGSEPVQESTIRQFNEAFAPYGFLEQTMLPVYGLAESTLATTIPGVNSKPRIEFIDAREAAATGQSVPATREPGRRLAMVSVGAPLPGHVLRVVDKNGIPLPDRQIGEIEFKGPSVISGYWDDYGAHTGDSQPQESNLKHPNGFMRTGDLGYLANGELYITGRLKDILILHGRNFIPNQIEIAVQKIIRSKSPNKVVACGIYDAKYKTERLHIIIERQSSLSGADQHKLEEDIRRELEEAFELTGMLIHWVDKGCIPKTTSGKIQRYLCSQLISGR